MAEPALSLVDSSSTQLQVVKPQTFAPQTFDEALKFADYLSQSNMIPAEFRGKPANILVAIQHGAELGLPPLQALNSICVINGKPSIFGPTALAVVKSHPSFEYLHETFDETTYTATCRIKRRGEPEVVRTFSKVDAMQAGLWDERKQIPRRDGQGMISNPAPWFCYPKRMCMYRARGFAMNDCMPDALRGIVTAEEAQDYPALTIEGTTTATVDTASTEKKPEPEKTIGRGKATEFYKCYRSNGWSVDESKVFLKDAFGIELPKNSADIPESGEAKAFQWASTKAPVRIDAEKAMYDLLGFTEEEGKAFCEQRKGEWPKILEDAKLELDKRNANER